MTQPGPISETAPGGGSLPGAAASVAAGAIGQAVAGWLPGGGVAGQLDAAGDAVIAARRWMSDRHNWVRVAWFAGGVILMIGGVAAIVSGTKAADKVVKTISAAK